MHFLRDVHTLMKEFPHDQALLTWAKAIYDVAVVLAAQEPDQRRTPREQQQARVAQQRAFEQQLWTLCPRGVLPWDMVDNSISLGKPIWGWFFIRVQSRQVTSSWKKAPSEAFRSHIPRPAHGMLLHLHLA